MAICWTFLSDFCNSEGYTEIVVQHGCNCSGKCGPCPLGGGCLVEKLVHKTKVIQDNTIVITYTGLTSNTFKKRFCKHRDTFKHMDHENPRTLSTHVWELKDKKAAASLTG